MKKYRITGDIDNGWVIEELSDSQWVEIYRDDGLLEAALWLEQIVEFPENDNDKN